MVGLNTWIKPNSYYKFPHYLEKRVCVHTHVCICVCTEMEKAATGFILIFVSSEKFILFISLGLWMVFKSKDMNLV